jgi:hypothetical protein
MKKEEQVQDTKFSKHVKVTIDPDDKTFKDILRSFVQAPDHATIEYDCDYGYYLNGIIVEWDE